MSTVMGYLTLNAETGAYKGPLHTLNIRAEIDVLPVRAKLSPAHPDYRVTASGVEIGAGWDNIGQVSGEQYVSLTLAHPDLGPRAYKVNLGRAAGQDDDNVYAMIWNPEG